MLREGMRVALVPPELGSDRWLVVESADEGVTGQLVGFVGVDEIGVAEALVGRHVLARIDDLPDDVMLHDVEALLDRAVRDAELGELGTIVEVMVGPANDVWVIEGTYGEVMLPVVPEVVTDVPPSGPIVVRAPRGTVDVAGGELL